MAKRVQNPLRCDTSTGDSMGCITIESEGSLNSLHSAAAGSAGVDVATAVDTTLTSTAVHLIDTSIKGPLGQGLCALLLGRSSTSPQRIFVLPGVIDADYTGVIKAMIYTLTPPLSIPAGRIAQLFIPVCQIQDKVCEVTEVLALQGSCKYILLWILLQASQKRLLR